MKTSRLAQGFTLIELMIAVAIVAILAAIAYPSYTSQVTRGKRVECRTALMESMQQQERRYTQFNRYAAFALGASSAATKSFSGETSARSNCLIKAEQCTGEGLDQCVKLSAEPTGNFVANAAFNAMTLTSYQEKGCVIGATTYTMTSANGPNPPGDKICWP
jgi:type IV pilus assembly protein PilE